MEGGRPTVMTPEVLRILEECFSYGSTDKEAIFIANISSTAFYDYCKQNPEFAERKERLKDMPKYQSRKNIVDKINKGDLTASQWYAERKMKDEFSIKQEVEHSGKLTISNVLDSLENGQKIIGQTMENTAPIQDTKQEATTDSI